MEATVEASDLEVINLELELLKFYFSKVRIVPLRSMKLRLQVWVKWLKKEARWDRWELALKMISIGWISLTRQDSWKIYKAANLRLHSD